LLHGLKVEVAAVIDGDFPAGRIDGEGRVAIAVCVAVARGDGIGQGVSGVSVGRGQGAYDGVGGTVFFDGEFQGADLGSPER
jgi:hypothetical protein